MCLQTYVPNFEFLAWLKVCHHQWLGGLWGFLSGDMDDMSLPRHFKCSSYMIPNLCTKCLISIMVISMSRLTLPSSVTWMTLRVTDQIHEDMGHNLLNNCSWHLISDLCVEFQHSSMIKSTSRTTLSLSVTWSPLRVPDRRHGGLS